MHAVSFGWSNCGTSCNGYHNLVDRECLGSHNITGGRIV